MRKVIIVRFIAILIVIATTVFTSSYHDVQGQADRKVECGEVIESEFIKNFEEHIYLITMNARDSFSVALSPVGDFLRTAIALYGPTGIRLNRSSGYATQSPSVNSGTLSARGVYKIQVVNAGLFDDGSIWTGDNGGVGVYTLYIECELISPTPLPLTPPTTIASTESAEQTSSLIEQNLPPIFEVNKTYEIMLPLSTYVMKVINLRSDGWVQVEYNNKVSWLNSNQVVLVTLIED